MSDDRTILPENMVIITDRRGQIREVPAYIIELTPPSSPEVSDSDSDLDSDYGIGELSLEAPQTASTEPTPLGNGTASQPGSTPPQTSMMATLINTWQGSKEADAPKQQIDNDRRAILDQLHHHPIFLADFHLLVPTYLRDRGLMRKLANCIAYHSSRGNISPTDKEAMLTAILVADFNTGHPRFDAFWHHELNIAPHLYLYNEVHARLAEFKPHSHRLQRGEHSAQPSLAAEVSTRNKIQRFPARMRAAPENPHLLPLGVTSRAQMYVEVLGLTWEDVREMPWGREREEEDEDLEGSFAETIPPFLDVSGEEEEMVVKLPPESEMGSPAGKEKGFPGTWREENLDWCTSRPRWRPPRSRHGKDPMVVKMPGG